MQIAGNTCRVCERNIVLSSEGKFCCQCRTHVHITCDPRLKCDVCNQSFQQYERPANDPLGDAVTPRALRQGDPGLTAVALVCLGFALLIIIVCFFMALLREGH